MDESSKSLSLKIHSTAEKAVTLYVPGILTPEYLSQLMMQECIQQFAQPREDGQQDEQVREEKEVQPSAKFLWRLAQRICSRTLYDACCSHDEHLFKLAYDNVDRSLMRFLSKVPYAVLLRKYDQTSREAVDLTLEELLKLQRGETKLDDPAAFLKWTQVIVHRKALAILNKRIREETLSIDQGIKDGLEEPVDVRNLDPSILVVEDEMREDLLHILAKHRNKNHIQVLMLQFLEDLDDTEIAQRMGVKIGTVRVWRHRAFHWLRKQLPPPR